MDDPKRHPVRRSHDQGSAILGGSIDDLIRPGVRSAYPLPEMDARSDVRFRLLLEAIRQRCKPER